LLDRSVSAEEAGRGPKRNGVVRRRGADGTRSDVVETLQVPVVLEPREEGARLHLMRVQM
jgi:hypothetical protein